MCVWCDVCGVLLCPSVRRAPCVGGPAPWLPSSPCALSPSIRGALGLRGVTSTPAVLVLRGTASPRQQVLW